MASESARGRRVRRERGASWVRAARRAAARWRRAASCAAGAAPPGGEAAPATGACRRRAGAARSRRRAAAPPARAAVAARRRRGCAASPPRSRSRRRPRRRRAARPGGSRRGRRRPLLLRRRLGLEDGPVAVRVVRGRRLDALGGELGERRQRGALLRGELVPAAAQLVERGRRRRGWRRRRRGGRGRVSREGFEGVGEDGFGGLGGVEDDEPVGLGRGELVVGLSHAGEELAPRCSSRSASRPAIRASPASGAIRSSSVRSGAGRRCRTRSARGSPRPRARGRRPGRRARSPRSGRAARSRRRRAAAAAARRRAVRGRRRTAAPRRAGRRAAPGRRRGSDALGQLDATRLAQHGRAELAGEARDQRRLAGAVEALDRDQHAYESDNGVGGRSRVARPRRRARAGERRPVRVVRSAGGAVCVWRLRLRRRTAAGEGGGSAGGAVGGGCGCAGERRPVRMVARRAARLVCGGCGWAGERRPVRVVARRAARLVRRGAARPARVVRARFPRRESELLWFSARSRLAPLGVARWRSANRGCVDFIRISVIRTTRSSGAATAGPNISSRGARRPRCTSPR